MLIYQINQGLLRQNSHNPHSPKMLDTSLISNSNYLLQFLEPAQTAETFNLQILMKIVIFLIAYFTNLNFKTND